MKTFHPSKILIPIDFSETGNLAIAHGAFMAKLFKADLLLLHVVEKHWQEFDVINPLPNNQISNAFAEKALKRIEEIAAQTHKEYGIVVNAICSVASSVSSEVVSQAKLEGVDLIVMGTHGISGVAEFFIGSNTYKTANISDKPVLSVQTDPQGVGFKKIVLPVDMSKHTLQKLAHTVEIAKKYASVVHVVGILSTKDEERALDIRLDQIGSYLKKNEVVFEATKIKNSNQAKATLEYAKKISADLIVIMTDQDEDIAGRLLGSYAQQIVNHSKIPVLSITPEINSELVEFHPW
jgi:nucleotide-binding universal stress UspA family protein